jgi:hypothetical protein
LQRMEEGTVRVAGGRRGLGGGVNRKRHLGPRVGRTEQARRGHRGAASSPVGRDDGVELRMLVFRLLFLRLRRTALLGDGRLCLHGVDLLVVVGSGEST